MLIKTSTRKQIQQQIGQLGSQKRYQLIQGIIFGLYWMLISLMFTTGFFVFMNPVFQCDGVVKEENQACQMLSNCEIMDKYTATAYCGIVCQKKNLRAVIQGAFYAGYILALFTSAPLSDTKGRRPSSLLLTLIVIFSQFIMYIGIQHSIYAFIILAQLINGVFIASMPINTYLFTAEYCVQATKQYYLLFFWLIGSFGEAGLYFFYTYFPEWNYFIMYGLGVPAAVLFVLMYFFVHQTPHFVLFLERDLGKFNACIDNLARFNNCTEQQVSRIKELGQKYYDEQQNNSQEQKQSISFFQSIKLIMNNRKYLWVALRLCISKLAVNAFYFALFFSFDRLGYNFGFTMLIFGLNQAFSSFIAVFVLEKVAKKPTLIVTMFLCALLGFLYFVPFFQENQTWQSILICLSTIVTKFPYMTLGLLEVEYFPAEISSTSIGLIDCLSHTMNTLMPFFVNFLRASRIDPVGGISIFVLILGIGPLIGLKPPAQISNNKLFDNQTASLDQRSDKE